MLKFYTKQNLLAHTNIRKGELKFGEVAGVVDSWDALQKSAHEFVLLGIPEDIWVRANYGKAGASKAWDAALTSLCNIQHTPYCNADTIIVLGEIDVARQMQQANSITTEDIHHTEKLGELVLQIDHLVSKIIEKIISFGKTPIIIGGGHNNSFGNLKGTSKALGKPVNCINFDAHTDFRALEHRHSGNGFSYASKKGFLSKYFIFGLHRNYTSQAVFESMKKVSERVQFNYFEAIAIQNIKTFSEALSEAEAFCSQEQFGLEIDLDAVANMGSSAMTPSGFSLEACRRFTAYFSAKQTCRYVHICEGAPNKELFSGQVGKAIAYLVSDVVSQNKF
jgi:formiminoglutamase